MQNRSDELLLCLLSPQVFLQHGNEMDFFDMSKELTARKEFLLYHDDDGMNEAVSAPR